MRGDRNSNPRPRKKAGMAEMADVWDLKSQDL